VTMPAWLRHHAGRDPRTAARLVTQGRKLLALPVLREAFDAGRLTGGQVEVICAHLAVRHLARFADHESELIAVLESLTVEETQTAMADWRARADALDDGALPAEHDNEVHLARTIGGRGELRGSLDANLTAEVEAALRVADPKDFDLTLAQRRADALGTVCRFFLDWQQTRTAGRHRPHLNVAFSYEDFCAGLPGTYLDTGAAVSTGELGVLFCDAAVHRVLVQGPSAVLDYGRATRTVPVDLYNVIVARDQGCRWPGCDRPASWSDAHHVHEWEHGGPTSHDNLVLLCRRHHRKLHGKQGWRAKLLPDGVLEITGPDGQTQTSHPRGPLPPHRHRHRP
jgi:hypothetical protein